MSQTPLAALGRQSRRVACALIAAFWPGREAAEIEERIVRQPMSRQVLVVGSALGALFFASLFAAQFGVVGMLVFLMLVIVVLR